MKKISYQLNLLWTPALILLLAVVSGVYGATPAGEGGTGTVAEMDRMLATEFPTNAPGAAILVVQNGTVKLRKGYGLADLEFGVPMDPSNVFPICSITKQFTAVAILQLVEAGKLKLTDELGMFVPDYPTGGAKITLTQLLTNTSGVPNLSDQSEWRKIWREDLTPDQVLDFTRNKPLEFAPGSDWKYSNTGFTLLGLVIEKASGQSYPDYVRTHLFAPAAMTHSYYTDSNRLIPRRIHGYSRSGQTWANAPYFNLVQAFSAGALLSTVDDLWAWEQALEAGRLVNTSLLASAYVEGHLPDGRGTHYGFGWEVNKLGHHDVIEHAGGIRGFAAYEAHVPDAGIYVVVLSNTDDLAVPLRTLVANLIRVALGETVVAPVALPIPVIEDFVGTYRMSSNVTFVITAKSDRLYGQLGPGRKQLKMIAPDEFITSGNEEFRFSFVRDAAHHIQKILVQPDAAGPNLIWPRVEAP
jgi:CubicO group peptidase (beta-lactamase class C family)